MTSAHAIALQRLEFSYPAAKTPVLRDANLAIDAGELVVVAGASGAGKSTLIRTLNGLVPHFSGGRIGGQVRVCGQDPVAAGPGAMSVTVGFVQQNPEGQFIVDTVEEELALGMENLGLAPALMRERIAWVLRRLDIAALRGRRTATLSAGQKQRVAIASALAVQPQVLVLDEPTSQLDPQAAEDVLEAVQQLNRTLGLTVVLTEHRLERVVPAATRLIYQPGAGVSLRCGAPAEVLQGMPFGPPVTDLAKALGWRPLPLTVEQARGHARGLALRPRPRPSSTSRGISVRVEGLWFAYPEQTALADIDLQLGEGEVVALMGRNGAGKSTLLRHLAGLLQPARGRVVAAGRDTRRTPVEQWIRRIGYVPQDPNALLFRDTVRDELAFTCAAHGLDGDSVERWLHELDLAPLAEHYPRALSVGERQRVALAAILVAEPSILLLDEPTRGLDALEKRALGALLRRLVAGGRTIVLATHDVELVAACADRVVVLEAGRVAADGALRDVLSTQPGYAPQMYRLFGDPHVLTVSDALEALR